MSLRLGLLGCGSHSQLFHVPALAAIMAERPNEVEISLICDTDIAKASVVQKQLGGDTSINWLDLFDANLDGLLAITPATFTPTVVRACVAAGLPVLMEKPLAASLEEAEKLVKSMGDHPHMVSMNRRFDPATAIGLGWLNHRPITHIHATFSRVARREPKFVEETGIHIVDAVSSIAGPLQWQTGDRWMASEVNHFHLRAMGCVPVEIDILPSLGIDQEVIVVYGEGYRLEMRSGWFDTGVVRAWEGKNIVLDTCVPSDWPEWRRAGVDIETSAFIASLQKRQAWSPTAEMVLSSARLCATVYHLSS